jgi:hypothetical protein
LRASFRHKSARSHSPMMLKGFGAWNVAIRLLPKRFDTTKTRCGHSAATV